MATFTQNGVIYEEMPDGKVRVVGYEDAATPQGGQVFSLPPAVSSGMGTDQSSSALGKSEHQQGRETNAPDLMRSVSLGEPNND